MRFSSSVLRLLPVLAVLAPGAGAGAAEPVRLVPHRAVYDLSLLASRGMRSIEGARGRIAFDLTGNACEGYTLKFRQVTVVESSESGSRISDLRTASYESADGRTFRFRNESATQGGPKAAVVDGSAERRARGPLAVRLKAPRRQSLALDGEAVFPNAQMRDLISAAREERHLVSMKLFDGSDDGRKVFETLAVIGPPVVQAAAAVEEPARQDAMAKLRRWPVTLSYFAPGSGDQTPTYLLGFELYENGVSRALRLDYGDFVLKGDLTRLELLPPSATCPR